MYTEFIFIYIGIVVITILLIAAIILLLHLLKKVNKLSKNQASNATVYSDKSSKNNSGKMVFCKKCFAPFDSEYQVCPKCGTPK